ncbi:MAG: hypothetical protein KDA89_15895, partial [Planctomycetaceae bacterium]|nr:hypothetical protein [Planctomycetaceae bacterium]
RVGLIGFALSLLQLVVHGLWIAFASWLAATGIAAKLKSGDWQLWVIAILIVVGAVLTMVSLFLCLYGSIRCRPKTLALTGLAISFFVGSFTTFALLLNALAKHD